MAITHLTQRTDWVDHGSVYARQPAFAPRDGRFADRLTPVFRVDLKQVEAEHPGVPRVDIRYLGVGGYLIKWGEDEIMMAPSFSNPDPLSLLFNTRPNPKIIDRMIPDVSDVDMILVGHAHYDHLLDVPYVMNKYAKKAKVYGSKTMKHLIASQVPANRIEIIEDKAGTAQTPGQWIYNPSGRIRFMAIKSDHAPNASLHGVIKTAWGNDYEWDWLFNVSEGSYDKDLDRMPLSAFEWKKVSQWLSLWTSWMPTETLPSASITKMRPARRIKGLFQPKY